MNENYVRNRSSEEVVTQYASVVRVWPPGHVELLGFGETEVSIKQAQGRLEILDSNNGQQSLAEAVQKKAESDYQEAQAVMKAAQDNLKAAQAALRGAQASTEAKKPAKE